MIQKQQDSQAAADPRLQAGLRAEKQMAHYLRREFGDSPELHLIHDLRLERNGDAAQIDHLLLHRFGVVIVESKSVITELRVNEHGEWSRRYGSKYQGIPSPLEQARRQGEFLRSYLQDHREQLRERVMFGLMQGGFRHMPIDLLVAISDEGCIQRPPGATLPDVLKADLVPTRIRQHLERHRRLNSPLQTLVGEDGYSWQPQELDRIARFLLAHHRSLKGTSPSFQPLPPRSPEPPRLPVAAGNEAQPQCRACRSTRLSIVWGRYGYYFKCGDCAGNTPIREICTRCKTQEKLRKDGQQFYAECRDCGTSRSYFVNPF